MAKDDRLDPWELPPGVAPNLAKESEFDELWGEVYTRFGYRMAYGFGVPVSAKTASVMKCALERNDLEILTGWIDQIAERSAKLGIIF
ncbi:MAG: hypothetical protein F4W90_10180 [Gammaproteobacteria bacterium]|nr:hypothetical protein [Gammaproteobacteria bacterium]